MAPRNKRPLPEWLDKDWVEYAFDRLYWNDYQTEVQWRGDVVTLITQFDGYVMVDQGTINADTIARAWEESYLCDIPDETLLYLEGASEEDLDDIRDGMSWFVERIAST